METAPASTNIAVDASPGADIEGKPLEGEVPLDIEGEKMPKGDGRRLKKRGMKKKKHKSKASIFSSWHCRACLVCQSMHVVDGNFRVVWLALEALRAREADEAPPAEREVVLVLGCSKCRWGKRGCLQCRDPTFRGKRRKVD